MEHDDRGEWLEYRRLVLAHIEQNQNDIAALETEVANLKLELNTLKVKAAVFGSLAGAVPAIIAIIISLIQ